MLLPVGRFVAVAVAVPTLAVLFLDEGFRADNLFLVPDLALCAMLVVGAVLPRRYAIAVLPLGFGFGAGVITTAVFSYVSRGAPLEGIRTMVVAAVCLVMAALLAARGARADRVDRADRVEG